MRNYKKYMDGVEVSPELHERLSHLTPAKGPAPWKKYGALAAALVLVVGAGALGLSRLGATDAGPAAEIAEEEPDIAPVTDPAQLPSQQLQTNGQLLQPPHLPPQLLRRRQTQPGGPEGHQHRPHQTHHANPSTSYRRAPC